jgi:lipoprotein-releasing system ATP-binding protein
MADTVLSLKQVVRTYRQGDNALTVLDKLDLDVRKGEIVALVGPSGSGKTTLLQIAGLLDTPTSGTIVVDEEELSIASETRRTLARRKLLGFVYQFHHLLPEFSALENVVLPQLVAGVAKNKAIEKAEELLGELGLSERLHHRPAKLSGGEQQRVAIARALANTPVLLLADEPTGNLDPHTAEQVFSLLVAQAKKYQLAALVATHNLALAARMDRIVTLQDGVLKSAA